MTHPQLVKTAQDAINKVFADNTVSQDMTRGSLVDLKEHIDVLLSALDK